MPLRSHGSLSVNRALMAAGLVDRVQVTIFPVISGRTGTDPVFGGAADFDLDLLESRTLDARIQELIYRPTCTEGESGRPHLPLSARFGRPAGGPAVLPDGPVSHTVVCGTAGSARIQAERADLLRTSLSGKSA